MPIPCLRIGVVGGSMAGCTAALLLERDGHDVHVFERSPNELEDHGAGIAAWSATLRQLRGLDLIDAELPVRWIRKHVLAGKCASERLGHMALSMDVEHAALRWGDLYGNLRRRMTAQRYHFGMCAQALVSQASDHAVVGFSDGSERRFDLLLWADGYRSVGRAALCPEVALEYRGYVLWRAVLDGSALDELVPLADTLFRVSCVGLPGHAVFYVVPALRADQPDACAVNMACYVPLPVHELAGFLVDREGRQRAGSLPPGSMRPELHAQLTAAVSAELPEYFADILARCRDSFAQPIYTAAAPRYHLGRVGLLGDAGELVQPLVGSGVLKASTNALTLVESLRAHDTLAAALAAWDAAQRAAAARMSAVAAQLERALIWQVPDFGGMDADATRAYWQRATRFEPT